MEKSKKKKTIIIVISVLVFLTAIIVGGVIVMNNIRDDSSGITVRNSKNDKDNTKKNKQEVKIKKSETKEIKFTEFNNGLFSMKIPEGWKVDLIGDYIHYTIKAYDPQNPTCQMFLI